ncbi:hypothetical protein Cni_G02988 [Canna indica]|uniref:Peptidase M48 domain-containing protein n=1 Tax=Canna indica TaxID=4628 RepID=A0AAQ3JT14_9LILI|nr:hypothetical protein Cni_G02988 [Canna indica]
MIFLRRANLSLTSSFLRRFIPKIPSAARSKVPDPIHPNPFSSSSPIPLFFSRSKPLSSSFSSSTIAKRSFYHAAVPEVKHFRRRPRWYQNPRAVFTVVIIGGGFAVAVYYGNLETVPYTKRRHFILVSPATERQLGEAQFQQLKTALRGKILPALHPDTVRVHHISKEIIMALQRGLCQDEQQWSDIKYASESHKVQFYTPERAQETVLVPSGNAEEKWSREDEILDDRWIQQSRREGEARGSKPMTKHLEGLNWEVLVVRDNAVNAFCLPGGKIVVFTGLLDHFRRDAEVATVISHEVGHAIARHNVEMLTKNLWLSIVQLIIFQFFPVPDIISGVSNLLLRLPFSRRMEIEADYIGILILAAAGYDPRLAPMMYEKLGKIAGQSVLQDYLSTHPSSKRRAQLLSQARVMDEALAIYRASTSGRGIEGFL